MYRPREDGEERHKLLLAVDEFNGLFNPCAARVSKFEPVRASYYHFVVSHDHRMTVT